MLLDSFVYYDQSSVGCIVDQQMVFSSLLESLPIAHIPVTKSHFSKQLSQLENKMAVKPRSLRLYAGVVLAPSKRV